MPPSSEGLNVSRLTGAKDLPLSLPPSTTAIKSILIEGLFGEYNYSIAHGHGEGAGLGRLSILYGDNGCGKTTILKLVFALLSSQRGRGEKGFIARTPFRMLRIDLEDGTTILAQKAERLIGDYTVSIERPQRPPIVIEIRVNETGRVPHAKPSDPVVRLYTEMADLNVALYFIADDRNVQTSLLRDTTIGALLDYRRLSTSQTTPPSEAPAAIEAHRLNVAPILEFLSRWFFDNAAQGASVGDENATSIHLGVIDRIVERRPQEVGEQSELDFKKRIEHLARETTRFSRLGFLTPFPAERLLSALQGATPQEKQLILQISTPFIRGMEAKLTALEPIQSLVSRYVETANSFLTNKAVDYTLHSGITVRSKAGVIAPKLLSSGEKQLLLLLSTVILARESRSIFLIDEPELSLNVKWQRQLIDGLLECTSGAVTQFILATHSLELISQYSKCVVHLLAK